MVRLIQSAIACAMVCGLALPAFAQEEKKPEGERRPGAARPDGERRPGGPDGRPGFGFGFGGPRGDMSQYLFSFPPSITLDDAQKAKLDELKKEYEPKMKDASARVDKIMTEERRNKQREAFAKLRESRERPENFRETMNAALGLSEEEQKELRAAEEERGKLFREIMEKKNGLLTEEQKKSLPQFGRRPEGDRPARPEGENRPNPRRPDAEKKPE